MKAGQLRECYRLAYNVKAGYQIRLEDQTWADVKQAIVFYSPLAFVRFELASGDHAIVDPSTRVMSRRQATQ